MGYRTGRMCRTYINTDPEGAGTYLHLGITKNPKLGLEWDAAEVSDESSDDKRYIKGLRDRTVSIEMNRKIGDTLYKAIRDAAYDADAIVRLAFCSGDMETAGEELYEADFIVTSFPLEGGLSDTQVVNVDFKLAANSDFEPVHSDVVAGP